MAGQLITEGRWPIEVKLHGDFRSRRLKNTNDELRQQDARLRQLLVETCGRFGLVVAGYSGRDGSIMGALEEAAGQSGAFPAGLFWFHREGDTPLPRVRALLAHAAANGVEAALVRIENFDEAVRDSVQLIARPRHNRHQYICDGTPSMEPRAASSRPEGVACRATERAPGG